MHAGRRMMLGTIEEELAACRKRFKARVEWGKAYAEWGKACAEWDNASAELGKACAEWNKAYAELDKARAEWDKARDELAKAYDEYHVEIHALHVAEVPDTAWNGESIFGGA